MTIDRDTHLAELIKRSGIVETLEREDQEKRAAAFEAARQRKKGAVEAFLVARPAAEARVDAAEERCQIARKTFEARVAELAKAAQARDQVVGDFTAVRDQVDTELRANADRRIDAVKAELQKLARGEGISLPANASHEDQVRAAARFRNRIDELERIRIAGELGEISDIGAALGKLFGGKLP